MDPQQFFAEATEQVRTNGWEGIRDVSYDLYTGFLWSKVSRRVGGRHVFDYEWDILVVLDACRADTLEEISPQYEFLGDVTTVRSVASTSQEWLQKTFTPDRREETASTTYVTANPFSDSLLDRSEFATLDEVWRDAWDENLGTVRAEPMTDRAIAHWRSGRSDRMIVHYMQPHFPSVPDPTFGSGIELGAVGEHWESVWDRLRKGHISLEAVQRAYRENLEYVLKSVEVLVSNLDAERVVVTADHGNSFGSWGVYGHPPAAIAAVREVPWCVTTARDESKDGSENLPSVQNIGNATEASEVDEEVASKLRDLGYL